MRPSSKSYWLRENPHTSLTNHNVLRRTSKFFINDSYRSVNEVSSVVIEFIPYQPRTKETRMLDYFLHLDDIGSVPIKPPVKPV